MTGPSTTPTAAAPTQYDEWLNRVIRGNLHFWVENWADQSTSPQYASWEQLARSRGVTMDVQYYMRRSLLSELIYAAVGVEHELSRLCTALAEVQQAADDILAQHAVKSPRWGFIATPAMRDASYSFTNMLTWARSVQERVERPYRPGAPERVGLLPALAPGQIHDAVQAAFNILKDALKESRFLTNYALHAGAVPGGGPPRAHFLPNGRIIARVPDPPADPVLSWDEFEFTQNRDMLTYGAELWTTIAAFVNKVLEAFEVNRPARAGPLPPPLI